MSRRAAAVVVGTIAALAVLALLWWSTSQPDPVAAPVGAAPQISADVELATAELFFPNTAGWLSAEERQLPATTTAAERAIQVTEALLAGPTTPGHVPPLSDAVELVSLHLSAAGVVYVDLAAPQLATPPVDGSRGELLAVFSFVNSILTNVPEASGVVLLWNGHQRPTFAGHVDTTQPLPLDSTWLASR